MQHSESDDEIEILNDTEESAKSFMPPASVDVRRPPPVALVFFYIHRGVAQTVYFNDDKSSPPNNWLV
jgi:hypothetical protein